MLGFIDSGLLAKEIVLNFPDQQQQKLVPDIYSAIKSLSLMILGTDPTPSLNSQTRFCKTLRNVCDEMFQLQFENDDPLDNDCLEKIEDLAQQAIDWKIKDNISRGTDTGLVQTAISEQRVDSDNAPVTPSGSQQHSDNTNNNIVICPTQPPPRDVKILIGLYCLCWGSTMSYDRFKPIYPTYQFSKSGIVLWLHKLEDWVVKHWDLARRTVEQFESSNPQDMPLRYIYEIRRDLLHRRFVSKQRICKVDIEKRCKNVLVKHSVLEKYRTVLTPDLYEAIFHATSKISWEKRFRGVTQDIYQRNKEWLL